MEQQDYLLGERFSIADAYLFTVLRWTSLFDIDLKQWPPLERFQSKIGARPAVSEALAAEVAHA
nr:glutathione binding-like protein [Pseudomonas brassicacearum]